MKLSKIIYASAMDEIHAIAPPSKSGGMDSIAWNGSADGSFSLSLAYASLIDVDDVSNSSLFNRIWKWPGPERIRCFLWKVARDALLTNQQRVCRNLANSRHCAWCRNEPEIVLHALRDCPTARKVWSLLLINSGIIDFYQLDREDWLSKNISLDSSVSKSWGLLFG